MSAPGAREARLVGAALRCYPGRWRRRHGDEAAELAALLIRDGNPAASIAWSYLLGAARAWLTPRPGRSLSTVAAALLAATCLLGFSAALVAETAPARAASTTPSPSGAIPPNTKPALPTCQFSPYLVPRPAQLADAVPAAGHSQLTIEGTAHARSC
jgi:hypothetical protein